MEPSITLDGVELEFYKMKISCSSVHWPVNNEGHLRT